MSPVVGQPVPRLESEAKATGRARYTADLSLPRMLHARLVRSQHPHANVLKVDSEVAASQLGVRAVVTSVELTSKYPLLHAFNSAAAHAVEGRSGDQKLFDTRVRYVGEPVAAVVADTDAHARRAAQLVEVEYQDLPAVLDTVAACAEGAIQLHAGAPGNFAQHLVRRTGDIDAALSSAALVLEEQFVTPRQKQAQLEPTCALADVDADGKITVWSPNQAPHRIREALADIFGIPLHKVRVINPFIGGSFGKGDGLTAEPYAVLLALLMHRPIKLQFSRYEDFVGTDARHPTRTRLTAGFRADATLVALRAHVIADAGAYLGHSEGVAAVMIRQFLAPYRIDCADLEASVIYTNTPVTGSFRGYGGPQACFPLEHMIDLGAARLGVDPLEARSRMRIRKGDAWRELGPIASDGFGTCLQGGAAAFDWNKKRARTPAETGPKRIGVGMACASWGSGVSGRPGVFDYSGAHVRLNADGSVEVATAGCDLGTGLRTTLAQICADALGVPLDMVHMSEIDTDITPYEIGAHASRSLYRNGQAVQIAAAHARRQVLEYAASKFEVAFEDLDLTNGQILVRGVPGRASSLSEVTRRALVEDHIEFYGHGGTRVANAPTFVAQFAEVAVDSSTGQVTLLRLLTAQDVGRAINPDIVAGQAQGAAHQGIGYALYEDLQVDGETGSVLNGLFMDYRVPTSMDAPTSEVILVEEPDPSGPFGAKGAGEPGIIPTAPAIANAIFHATGASMTQLPMTPERVLAALRATGREMVK
jgi:xanthine dehydrogenase molybdenum-binding subunit